MSTPQATSRPGGLNHPLSRRSSGRLARSATADEAAALWPRLDALYADLVNYRRWTDREIPVVVLEPR